MSRNEATCEAASNARRLTGHGIAEGQAVGIAYRIEPQYPAFYRIRISEEEVEKEIGRLHSALDKSREQYLLDKEKFERAIGREHSYIIDAHLLMLEDSYLLSEIERLIREQLASPEKALIQVSDQLLTAYNAMQDPFFRERAFDFQEVIERIIGNLMELRPGQDVDLPEDLILVAPEIGLSVLAHYSLENIRGLVLTRAGRTSHVTIIARSYQIPVVSGIENIREHIRTGDLLCIDGTEGFVDIILDPVADSASSAVQAAKGRAAVQGDREPCMTVDGERIYLLANTEFGSEVPTALKFGAEGIGLFRSEYLHIRSRMSVLDESEHTRTYSELAKRLEDLPAVIRTLDIAVPSENGPQAGEEGAALGMRGVRLSLQNPKMFQSQIRAILQARRFGDLRIVLPMISSVDELLECRKLIAQVETSLDPEYCSKSPVPVGLLIEVPATVLTIDAIAKHADFLAVGTNDLIQYTLAAGRLNEDIAYLYNPVHPAILCSLTRVVEAAKKNGIEAMVCGEMATHPVYAALLVGIGFRHLSMTAVSIPGIKQVLRSCSAAKLAEAVERLLNLDSLQEIEGYLYRHFGSLGKKENPRFQFQS